MLPSVFLGLDEQERAFVVAAIRIKVEKDGEEKKKAEKRIRKKGG